jgi:hypothetical protein
VKAARRVRREAARKRPSSRNVNLGPRRAAHPTYSDSVPAGIRTAVLLRDRHCRWPGCRQPAAACEVHHVRHKADGGNTSTKNCILLCFYHHQVVIHRQGWTLVLNPDGTTTACNPDRTKVLHSHGPPPARPGAALGPDKLRTEPADKSRVLTAAVPSAAGQPRR